VAERFVDSLPRIARYRADPSEARAFEQTLRSIGAIVEVKPSDSVAPPPSGDLPSLPTPPTHSSAIPQYDSSAKLAARIPRAPAVPAEAWHKPAPGAADEFGNPVDGSSDLAVVPAPRGNSGPEADVARNQPSSPRPARNNRRQLVQPSDARPQGDAQAAAAGPLASDHSTQLHPRWWLGLLALAALIASLWQLAR